MSDIKSEVEQLAALQRRVVEAKARILRAQANFDQLATLSPHTGQQNKLLHSMVNNLEAMEAHYQQSIAQLDVLDKQAIP
jgi:hypothetical protein